METMLNRFMMDITMKNYAIVNVLSLFHKLSLVLSLSIKLSRLRVLIDNTNSCRLQNFFALSRFS